MFKFELELGNNRVKKIPVLRKQIESLSFDDLVSYLGGKVRKYKTDARDFVIETMDNEMVDDENIWQYYTEDENMSNFRIRLGAFGSTNTNTNTMNAEMDHNAHEQYRPAMENFNPNGMAMSGQQNMAMDGLVSDPFGSYSMGGRMGQNGSAMSGGAMNCGPMMSANVHNGSDDGSICISEMESPPQNQNINVNLNANENVNYNDNSPLGLQHDQQPQQQQQQQQPPQQQQHQRQQQPYQVPKVQQLQQGQAIPMSQTGNTISLAPIPPSSVAPPPMETDPMPNQAPNQFSNQMPNQMPNQMQNQSQNTMQNVIQNQQQVQQQVPQQHQMQQGGFDSDRISIMENTSSRSSNASSESMNNSGNASSGSNSNYVNYYQQEVNRVFETLKSNMARVLPKITLPSKKSTMINMINNNKEITNFHCSLTDAQKARLYESFAIYLLNERGIEDIRRLSQGTHESKGNDNDPNNNNNPSSIGDISGIPQEQPWRDAYKVCLFCPNICAMGMKRML